MSFHGPLVLCAAVVYIFAALLPVPFVDEDTRIPVKRQRALHIVLLALGLILLLLWYRSPSA
jgi:hypothetical protein